MEMLELAAELKWCRERIDALEAERDQLLYSERLHAEALGTAVQEAESLRSERAQLRAELAELFDDIRRATNREIARGTETNRLRAELASWQEAFGLLTTLHGSVQIDSSDPMGMAKQIEAQVLSRLAELRKPDCRTCAYCRTMIPECRLLGAVCVGGDHYIISGCVPLRLYEKEEK